MKKKLSAYPYVKTSIFSNFVILSLILGVATGICFCLHALAKSANNTSLVYILAIMTISRATSGYLTGIIACILSIIFTNYLFTYPYHTFNFTLDGYPLTVTIMLLVSITTSAITSNMREQASILAKQDKLLAGAEKEKMRANLLRAISHDLRTPLTSIIGASSSYLENSRVLREEEKQVLVENILQDSNWLLNMVENLLSVTRISKEGKAHITKSLEPVEEVVSEAIFRFKKRYPEAAVTVKVPDELIMIPMDAMLIEQVIVNLLENAILHSHSQLPIECIVEQDGNGVLFHINDYGVGISPEKLPTLFDGTSSLNNDIADGHKGIGIGLSICRTIVTANGGTIHASNHKDKTGVSFTFSLPGNPLD